ncbi:right-handed parallel beta-helix repeat-containing protein, partial [Candidatus Saccharibacteria bacterium]|nr:right-handed parallel beta-helix repeat-containing protein [Candidatus Saccharibacteria bacterium]
TLGAYTSGVNNDETNGSYGLPHLDAAKADLMIIALGINDWQGATSVSTIKDALTNLIVRQRSSGTASGGGDHADGDVMLLWNPIPNIAALGKSESLWEDYRQAYYEVADEQNCALLDLGLVWDDYATGSGLGYYADTIHLSDSGSAIVAQKVAQSIFGSDVNEYLAAGDTTSAPTVAINWFSDDFGIRTDISESNSYVTWNSACPDPGEWFHYSVVMDAGNDLAYLYINGTRVSVKPMTYDYGTPGNLQLGARKDGIGPYEGSMQGFSVHERVLTASEIADAVAADNYESTMRGYSGLSMYLPLCEDNGLNDLSGLSNHGSENGGMTIGGDTSEAPAPGRDSLWSIVAARGLQGESNSITVEDYGAVGDGVQDDTFAIQSAIDAAGTAGGGTVLLTPGHTYVISDTLSGVANLHIVGYGATIELTTTSNIDALVFDTVDNVRVTGVTIDGIKSTKTSDTDTGRGIYILQADNVTIEDCYIHDCYEDGVRVGGLVTTHDDQDTTNVRIINNRFDSCGNDAHHAGFGVKLYWRVKDSVISGNLIEACDAGGICVDDVGSGADTGKECYGITVANNVLTDNGTTPANTASIGIKVQGSLEWSISNNVITGSYRGISVGIGEASASTGRATIDANKIEAVYMGIRLQDTEDIAITGNQITVTGSTTAYEGGVVLEETAAAAPNLSRISIVGNNIVSNATGINSRLSTNYAGATGVLIADNSLHCTEGTPGGTDNGMNLYYLDDLHVVGNHVDG